MSQVEVSIIIPARNEERNLPRLLRSIGDVSNGSLEVIVVDDGSKDRTPQVATQWGAQVVPGRDLPSGWTGKAWACHQGAEVARGRILIFLDADTWFEREGLRKALEAFKDRAEKPMSILPYHWTLRSYELLSLFFNVILAFGVLGEGQLSGQTLFVLKRDYLEAGGHEAVRGKILENLHLAPLFFGIGRSPSCLAGRGLVSMRMYPEGAWSLIQGWGKAFADGASRVGALRMGMIGAWISAGWAAFCWLVLAIVARMGNIPLAIAAYVLFAIQLAVVSSRIGRFQLLSFALYPVPLLFFHGVFARSFLARKRRRGVDWKGRRIPSSYG